MKIINRNQTQVIISQQSVLNGKTNAITINLSYDAFIDALDKWLNGELIQNAFPTLSEDEREFILTGITPAEWESMFAR